jgi:predicted metal-binding membrane protein
MAEQPTSHRLFIGTTALLFVITSALTVVLCRSMSAMGSMQMPGGWTMSMAWMRMPGQSWYGAAASFTGMWIVMMAAMMLPSLVPMLCRYRRSVERTSKIPLDLLTAVAGIGYFLIWTMWGIAIFPLGAALAELEMDMPALARTVPAAIAGIVLIAGAVQFSGWKLRNLACCRQTPGHGSVLPGNASTALKHGFCLGLHCSLSCANLTIILLVAGVMDLRTMVLVTVAISAERLTSEGERIAWMIGIGLIGTGLFLVMRALAFR